MPEKIALCSGINDYPAGLELSGCANDAKDCGELFASRGFEVLPLILDREATKKKLLEEFRKWVLYLGPNDLLIWSHSGHGTSILATDATELDGRDEAIVTVDLLPITDNEIFEITRQAHPKARIVGWLDTCHAGTANKMLAEVGRTRQARVKFCPPSMLKLPPRTKGRSLAALDLRAPVRPKEMGGAMMLLAAAAPHEYAYDAWFGTRPNGAFTRAAIDALSSISKTATYNTWMKEIRKRLPSVIYPQTPQLDGDASQRRRRVLN